MDPMPLSGIGPEIHGYPIDQNLHHTSQQMPARHPTMLRPLVPYSTAIPPQHNSTAQYPPPRHLPYQSMSDESMTWSTSEQLSDDPFYTTGTSLPAPHTHPHRDQQYAENLQRSYPSAQNMQDHATYADMRHVPMPEVWGSAHSPDLVKVDSTDKQRSGSSSASFSPQSLTFSPTSMAFHGQTAVMMPGPDNFGTQDRSGLSSPSKNAPPKTRQNSAGQPCSDYLGTPESSYLPEKTVAPPKTKPSVKASHSVVERKYRENLNSRITELDALLVHTRQSKTASDKPDKIVAGKTRKADVLNEAMRYVRQAELSGKQKDDEIAFLKLRVVALENLVGRSEASLMKAHSGQLKSGHMPY